MVEHKGLLGVLDGYFPWGSIQCFVKGASFGFGHAIGRNMFRGHVPDDIAEVLAGGVGGGFQGIVLSPLLLLKTRVMTDPSFRSSGGMLQTTIASTKVGMDVIRNEGPAALMKGASVFTIKRVGDWTTRFFFAELVANTWRNSKGGEKLTGLENSCASLLGGALSATVTLPIDVLVATIQDASKAGEKVRVMDVWKERIASGGIRSLVEYSTRGYLARVAHVALTTLLMKTVSSQVYAWYQEKQEAE